MEIWKDINGYGGLYKAIQIKKQLSKNEYSIYECCLGKRKTAYGFKWAFAQ